MFQEILFENTKIGNRRDEPETSEDEVRWMQWRRSAETSEDEPETSD